MGFNSWKREKLYTLIDAFDILQINPTTIRKWDREGMMPDSKKMRTYLNRSGRYRDMKHMARTTTGTGPPHWRSTSVALAFAETRSS
ncbi:hypothetical protein IX51_10280 [uncultured archaeon]|nr:hypothetical protein IX51_10280 [uncultured archaeon]